MDTKERDLRADARKALLVAIALAAKEEDWTAAYKFASAYGTLGTCGVDEDQNVPPGSA